MKPFFADIPEMRNSHTDGDDGKKRIEEQRNSFDRFHEEEYILKLNVERVTEGVAQISEGNPGKVKVKTVKAKSRTETQA